MKHMKNLSGLTCLVVAAGVAAVLAGCAGTCGVASKGTTLEYRMNDGDAASYRMTSDMVQTMQYGETSVPVESTEVLEFSVTSGGTEGGLIRLGVTVDDLSVVATSPQGSGEADVSGAVGGTFDMTLTRLGEEGSLPETDAVVYTLEPQGPKSLIPIFGAMFPDLPGHPIDIGDSWPSTLEMIDDSGNSVVSVTIDAVNTLDGFETVGGMKCARISSVLSGTIEASGVQDGAEWSLSSATDGTGVCYFAHEDGLLVSDSTEGTADGSITVQGPTGEIVIPVSRTYTMTTELIQ